MTQTLSPIDQFLHDYNTHAAPLSIPQKCHLLGVLAIQMEWNQEFADNYTLTKADTDHPFEEPATQRAIALLDGQPPQELASWMLELARAIEEELEELASSRHDANHFGQQYNTYAYELTIPEKCHLLGVLAIQMEWDQDHPCDNYTVTDADSDHPFLELVTENAVFQLEGKSPHELSTWMLELATAVENELSKLPE